MIENPTRLRLRVGNFVFHAASKSVGIVAATAANLIAEIEIPHFGALFVRERDIALLADSIGRVAYDIEVARGHLLARCGHLDAEARKAVIPSIIALDVAMSAIVSE